MAVGRPASRWRRTEKVSFARLSMAWYRACREKSETGLLQVEADPLSPARRELVFDSGQQRPFEGGRGGRLSSMREDLLVVAPERVQRVGPGITLVRPEAMEDPERRQLAVWPAQLERPGERRDIPEVSLLRQEPPELKIGIGLRLETAEKLKDEAVAVDHRCVGLLGLHDGRLQEISRRPQERAEIARRRGDHFAESPAEAPASGDEIEEAKREARIHHRVVEDPFLL